MATDQSHTHAGGRPANGHAPPAAAPTGFGHRDNDMLYNDAAIHSTPATSTTSSTHAAAAPIDAKNSTGSNPNSNNSHLHNNHDHMRVGPLGVELGYLPPDQRPAHITSDILDHIDQEMIEDDTEAAEALRANANIKVGKVGKIARSVNAQTVRRIVKRATLRGKSGTARGKPPRVPPGKNASKDPDADIYVVEEEGEEDDIDHDHDDDSGGGSEDDGSVGYDVQQQQSLESADDAGAAAAAAGGDLDRHAHAHIPTERLPHDDIVSPSKKDKAKLKFQNHNVAPPATLTAPEPLHVQHLSHGHDGVVAAQTFAQQQQQQHHNRNAAPQPPHTPSRPVANSAAAVAPWDDDDKFKREMRQHDAKDIPPEVYNATVDAGKKFLGAVDPHNLLTKQRWRRKKKSGKKNRKSYVKGKVIDGKHELYALSIAVMLGVRTSIAKTNSAITAADGRRTLVPQDFMTEEKYEFAPKGSATTPPHKLSHTFKFKDYAPMAFAFVRRMFGVNEFDFLLSVCGNANFIEFISNAKSGQFFFYSSDGKYMIKTMTNAESKFLRRILPHYFKHCTQNPNTLLPKFYGMYRVKLYHLRRNVKFVIMNSVYYTDKYLQSFYDLKGSVLGRTAKPGQDVLKDNDLRNKLPNESLSIYPDVRVRLRQQIVNDCTFLQNMQIMDYSLLVGIHHIPATNAKRRKQPQQSQQQQQRDDSSYGSDNNDYLHPSTSTTTNDILLLEDEDDNSYLDERDTKQNQNDDIEYKKEHTIEQIYWPFHRFYDINGNRRLYPRTSSNSINENDKLLKQWNIPEFILPLSNRKDGGFMMDTTTTELPMYYTTASGERRPCSGKIFFMGVIDILQQYNMRKRVETSYRKVEGYEEPSCVSPKDYADRFIEFFDEYSAPCRRSGAADDTKTAIEVSATGEVKVQEK
eukprot:CAMPEP_0119552110 /NCGR_PEP_ID=MMETSP1352-20130426/5197_1 /TAXON_ID=265584 /ORGANISM="Stauroneis constricta, Strain CCMP1120" /LENGTH=915 /DNA_ID=CAMNT_0007598289 /DNA_START=274 /DNA_END=3021 /DNA_ORIENTATION=+